MASELEGKVAVVTGAASGIGLASAEAMLAAGARVVMVDRDEAALEDAARQARRRRHPAGRRPARPEGLRDAAAAGCWSRRARSTSCTPMPAPMSAATSSTPTPAAIDRMLNLNVNVVMKNVHDVLPHMIERGTGDIIVTSSLAAHFPTPWEPVYASSKWAINCFVQTVRRQVFKHGIRVGSISPGPVITALLADWPAEKLQGGQGIGQPARGQRSRQCRHFHADAAARHDDPRRRHDADQLRPVATTRRGYRKMRMVREITATPRRLLTL